MTMNGVIALILRFSPKSITLLANYVIFNILGIHKLSSLDLNKPRVNINYSMRQAVPNINNSISERKFPKIIMTSIF